MVKQLEELRKGKIENIVEITNIEFNMELSKYLGNEMANWNVKSVKLMRNKM